MFSSNYYTLVAGLREYALDADTKGFDITEILAEVEESLSSRDWQSVELLYTYYDCENLVARHNGSSAHNALGLLSPEQVAAELENPTTLPKALAKEIGEGYTLKIAAPLSLIGLLLTPLSALFTLISRLVTKLFSKNQEPTVTEDDVIDIIEDMEEDGSIDSDESRLLYSAFEFSEVSVADILTDRRDVLCLDISASEQEVLDTVKASPYSRIPVYEESIDNIIGILVVQKLFKQLIDTPKEEIDLRSLLVEPYFIHMTVKLDDALDVLREERTHIMIVLDEFGGTLGIATMEDILEELVGEIWDEDEEIEHDIVKAGPDKYSVEGDMNIFDFFDSISHQ